MKKKAPFSHGWQHLPAKLINLAYMNPQPDVFLTQVAAKTLSWLFTKLRT